MPVRATIPAAEAPAESPARHPLEMSASTAEAMHASVRKIADQSLERSGTAYVQMRAVPEEAKGSFESSYAAATKGLNEFNAKAIDVLKSNADATFDFLKALMSVKTFSEAITLQSEHARKQFEVLTAQGQELAEIARTFGKAA